MRKHYQLKCIQKGLVKLALKCSQNIIKFWPTCSELPQYCFSSIFFQKHSTFMIHMNVKHKINIVKFDVISSLKDAINWKLPPFIYHIIPYILNHLHIYHVTLHVLSKHPYYMLFFFLFGGERRGVINIDNNSITHDIIT